jgi:hypothetical protein
LARSGSGKSSVGLAGLAPRLNADSGRRFGHFRIVKSPFFALARASCHCKGSMDRLEEVETARTEDGW